MKILHSVVISVPAKEFAKDLKFKTYPGVECEYEIIKDISEVQLIATSKHEENVYREDRLYLPIESVVSYVARKHQLKGFVGARLEDRPEKDLISVRFRYTEIPTLGAKGRKTSSKSPRKNRRTTKRKGNRNLT